MTSVSDDSPERTGESKFPDSPAARKIEKLVPHMERSIDLLEQGKLKAGSYLPVELTQLSLPYRDPKDIPFWHRENGGKKLIIEPALLPDKNGDIRRAFPFGSVPRLFLIWLTTEVKMQGKTHGQPITVELGENLSEFMRHLGLGAGGGTQRRRVMDQMNRLVRARITILETSTTGGKNAAWSDEGRQLSLASAWNLWHAGDDDQGQAPLIGSYIEVSPEFARAIDKAVPLVTEILRELQTHPMRLDIYVWLVHRLYNMRSESHVSWSQLQHQFGGSYKEARKFRAAFKENLQVVRMYYPKARVAVAKNGLILRPSKRHVPERGDRYTATSGYDIVRDLSQSSE